MSHACAARSPGNRHNLAQKNISETDGGWAPTLPCWCATRPLGGARASLTELTSPCATADASSTEDWISVRAAVSAAGHGGPGRPYKYLSSKTLGSMPCLEARCVPQSQCGWACLSLQADKNGQQELRGIHTALQTLDQQARGRQRGQTWRPQQATHVHTHARLCILVL